MGDLQNGVPGGIGVRGMPGGGEFGLDVADGLVRDGNDLREAGHDVLPAAESAEELGGQGRTGPLDMVVQQAFEDRRSEEHTSELQSRGHLVCRLLLEKIKLRRIDEPY